MSVRLAITSAFIATFSLAGCAQMGDTGTQIGMQLSNATGQILGTIAGRAVGR